MPEEDAFVISLPNSLAFSSILGPVAVITLSLGVFLLFSLFPVILRQGTDEYDAANVPEIVRFFICSVIPVTY